MSNKISVIIPLFNKGAYINRAINSLLSQTILPDQIIIIDDASTDEGSIIAQTWAQKNPNLIEYHVNEINKGASFSRNRGIQIANSGYIMFLDADDEYAPSFIATVKEQITKHPSENIFISACAYFPTGFLYPLLPNGLITMPVQQIQFTNTLHFIPFVGGSNVIFKKTLVSSANTSFDESEKNYEDWLFYFTLLKVNDWRFTFIQKPLYLYHENIVGGLSTKNEHYTLIKEPKVVQALKSWGYNSVSKIVYSIWLSSSYTKINSRLGYVKFLRQQGISVFTKCALNKYTLQVISKFLLPEKFVNGIKSKIRKKV